MKKLMLTLAVAVTLAFGASAAFADDPTPIPVQDILEQCLNGQGTCGQVMEIAAGYDPTYIDTSYYCRNCASTLYMDENSCYLCVWESINTLMWLFAII